LYDTPKATVAMHHCLQQTSVSSATDTADISKS